ncbi:MAG: hypothetical protein EOO11_18000 [Chitinophagaceae bacterium]|nr:MAG: hypothetical protein EOO11_18000 [Chitinophagaceae bacterium]
MSIFLRRTLSVAGLSIAAFSASAQEKVFRFPIGGSSYYPDRSVSARLVFDQASGEKLLLMSNKKNVSFIVLDSGWKKLREFEAPAVKGSLLARGYFDVEHAQKNGHTWTLFTSYIGEYACETVNAVTASYSVDEKLLNDLNTASSSPTFYQDGSDSYLFYTTKRNKTAISVARFGAGAPRNYDLVVDTRLPLRKKHKYSVGDLYAMSEPMNETSVRDLALTRKKVQVYTQPDALLIGIAEDEPVAELNWFDKTTGTKLRSELFSVEDLLPERERKNDFNTSFIIHEGKIWVLTAHKNGGALGAFDLASKKLLYSFFYDDRTDPTAFAYTPCMFETLPGTFARKGADKERVKDISMNNFCKELFFNHIGLAIFKGTDGLYRLVLGNHELKSFDMSSRSNASISSPLYYTMASAGLFIDAASMKAVARRASFNDVYGGTAGRSYTRQRTSGTAIGGTDSTSSTPANCNCPDQKGEDDKSRKFIGSSVFGDHKYYIYLLPGNEVKVFEH